MNEDDLVSSVGTQFFHFVAQMGNTGEAQTFITEYSGMLIVVELIVFCICLLVSAFFSGSETALTSMSKLRVKRLFSEGEGAYQKLEPWLKEPNRFLATILIGNNFVNILASVIAAHLCELILLEWFQVTNAVAYGSAMAVAITTFLLLVFGEIVPKTFSKEHAVSISLKVIGPLDTMYKILRPFIGFFVWISNLIIRLTGGREIREVPLLTEDDVRTLIELSEKEGVLEEDEREMIHSIIDFGETYAKEIMTPRVDIQAIQVNLGLEEVRREAICKGHSRIPVYEENLDQIVGILFVKDLLRVENGDRETFNLRNIVRPALFVPKSKKVDDLLQTFQTEKNHMAIVVDEYGLTAGLVTIEDVLEEIVGDIQDEYDQELPDYEIQNDGSILADAKIDLDILSEVLSIEFPEEDVETLGGFISSLLGEVPPAGEKVEFKNHQFIVLESDERKIRRVKIVKLPPHEEPVPGTLSEIMPTDLNEKERSESE